MRTRTLSEPSPDLSSARAQLGILIKALASPRPWAADGYPAFFGKYTGQPAAFSGENGGAYR